MARTSFAQLAHSSEEQLIEYSISGNSKAFEILYLKYRSTIVAKVLQTLNKSSIGAYQLEDILQEVQIHLYRGLVRKKFAFLGEGSFSAWAVTVASNRTLDLLRSKYFKEVRKELPNSAFQFNFTDPSDNTDGIPLPLESSVLEQFIRDSVQQLPSLQAEAIIRHVLYQERFAEISEALKVKSNTVQGWYYRWKEKIKPTLSKEFLAAA